MKDETARDRNLRLLREKIFDIVAINLNDENSLKLNGDQFLAAVPHAVEALKILNALKLDPSYSNGDPVVNCAKHLFKQNTSWEMANYLFKLQYFSIAINKIKDNRKIAEHLGMSLTSVVRWKKILKKAKKI